METVVVEVEENDRFVAPCCCNDDVVVDILAAADCLATRTDLLVTDATTVDDNDDVVEDRPSRNMIRFICLFSTFLFLGLDL